MNNVILDEKIKIEEMIFEVRGKQVMLDSNLAKLYGVETKRINEAVKNNLEKFPERFSWVLMDDEWKFLRSKFSTSSISSNHGGRRYNPRVFTEQGVAMLTSVLRTNVATMVSISIMRAFVNMRHYILENKDVYQSLNNINNKLIEHDEKINYIFSKFDKKEQLFLPGKTYDAYSEISSILNDSKYEVIIIDSYADKTLLDYIRNIDVKFILITSDKAKLTKLELDKFNKQYNKLKVIKNNTFYDRYFIIDRNKFFHIGTSLNYIGEKIFTINKLEDGIIKENLLDYVLKII